MVHARRENQQCDSPREARPATMRAHRTIDGAAQTVDPNVSECGGKLARRRRAEGIAQSHPDVGEQTRKEGNLPVDKRDTGKMGGPFPHRYAWLPVSTMARTSVLVEVRTPGDRSNPDGSSGQLRDQVPAESRLRDGAARRDPTPAARCGTTTAARRYSRSHGPPGHGPSMGRRSFVFGGRGIKRVRLVRGRILGHMRTLVSR